MSERLSSKRRYYILIVVILIISIVAYKMSISKTIQLNSNLKMTKSEIENNLKGDSHIEQLEKVLADYEDQINNRFSQEQSREYLLKVAGYYCEENRLTVINLPDVKSERNNGLVTSLNNITVEGKYKELLGLLYMLERDDRVGSIESVLFTTEDKYRTRNKILLMTITVKSISTENEI